MLFLPYRIELELLGVLCAQFENGQFVSLCRYSEIDTIHLDIRQERHNDLAGYLSELGLDFSYEFTQDRRRFLFDVHPESKVQGLDNGSSPDTHEIAESFIDINDKREHIHVGI